MSKDQMIGGLIFVVCVIVIIGYIVGMFFYPYVKPAINLGDEAFVQKWLVAIPVLVAFVAVLGIGAWIGWTMATTPPPKPIEEIEAEEKKEEEKVTEEKTEEKKK
jgi:H+/gluconate symporter-like permease